MSQFTSPNLDGLFCGDGPSEVSTSQREQSLNRIVNGPLSVEMLVIAWESGHDAGMLIERAARDAEIARLKEADRG